LKLLFWLAIYTQQKRQGKVKKRRKKLIADKKKRKGAFSLFLEH
jgi:hypothetical protein